MLHLDHIVSHDTLLITARILFGSSIFGLVAYFMQRKIIARVRDLNGRVDELEMHRHLHVVKHDHLSQRVDGLMPKPKGHNKSHEHMAKMRAARRAKSDA